MIPPAKGSSFIKIVNSYETTFTLSDGGLEIKVKDDSNESGMVQQHQIPTLPFIPKILGNEFQKNDNAKKHTNCKSTKFFMGKFKHETLPEECKYLFDNVQELYSAFQNQEISLEKKEEIVQFILKLNITMKQKAFSKYIKFLLAQIEYSHNSNIFQCQQNKSTSNSYQKALQQQNKKLKQNLAEVVQKYDGPLQAAEKVKNTIQGIQIFVREFINKIKQKWVNVKSGHQQTRKTVQQLKISHNMKLNTPYTPKNAHSSSMQYQTPSITPPFIISLNVAENIQKFPLKTDSDSKRIKRTEASPKPTNDSFHLLKINFTFSARYKNEAISLLSPMKAKCVLTTMNYKVIMIEPLSFSSFQNAELRNYQVAVRINELGSYIAFGICEKQHIIKANFQSSQADSRGCYLLDWSGKIWSDYPQKHISKNAFRAKEIRQGDVIKMTFRCSQRILTFSNYYWNKPRYIDINPRTNLRDFCFCAILQGNGDEVEILGPKPLPESIDLQSPGVKEFKKEQSDDEI